MLRYQGINGQTACPLLEGERTYGRHGEIDANDPKPVLRMQRGSPRGLVYISLAPAAPRPQGLALPPTQLRNAARFAASSSIGAANYINHLGTGQIWLSSAYSKCGTGFPLTRRDETGRPSDKRGHHAGPGAGVSTSIFCNKPGAHHPT